MAPKPPADGYTIIQTGVGQNAVAHGLDPNLKYDSVKDFIHISHVHNGPNVLVVNASQPYRTLADLVKAAKANPGKLDYGYTHAASGHMAMELFKQTAGHLHDRHPVPRRRPHDDRAAGQRDPDDVHQPGRGPAPHQGRQAAPSGGQQPAAKFSLYPDVPTVAESGYSGFEALSWSGMSVPKGTPAPIVAKLEAAFKEVMSSPAIKQKMEGNGFVVPVQGVQAVFGLRRQRTAALGQGDQDRWHQAAVNPVAIERP